MKHPFKAHKIFFYNESADDQHVFYVDKVRSKNSRLRVTVLASTRVPWGNLLLIRDIIKDCTEITKKDLPLYLGYKFVSPSLARLLKGEKI